MGKFSSGLYCRCRCLRRRRRCFHRSLVYTTALVVSSIHSQWTLSPPSPPPQPSSRPACSLLCSRSCLSSAFTFPLDGSVAFPHLRRTLSPIALLALLPHIGCICLPVPLPICYHLSVLSSPYASHQTMNLRTPPRLDYAHTAEATFVLQGPEHPNPLQHPLWDDDAPLPLTWPHQREAIIFRRNGVALMSSSPAPSVSIPQAVSPSHHHFAPVCPLFLLPPYWSNTATSSLTYMYMHTHMATLCT